MMAWLGEPYNKSKLGEWKMKRSKLVVAALLGASLMASPVMAKSLVYCSEGSPENFNPQINTTGTSLDAARPVYNQLVEFAPGTVNVVPALAEKWEVSADGKTITFNLRKGVKFGATKYFTPTRDFNADDVLFSFNRQWKEDNAYHKVSGGAYDYFNDMGMPDLLESIEKTDEYTVVFKLKEPNAPIIANLAMDFATIMSAEYADAMMAAGTPEKLDQEPVGTGPFSFVAYQKDAVIRFKARADYWGGAPKIDDLVFAITPDASARYAKIKANECQVMIAPNPADLEIIKADPNVTLLEQAGLNIGYLALNAQKAPFDNVKVRQAINYAIDRDSILKEVYQGAGQKAKNLIPPTIWSYNDAITDYPFDQEKAKALLAEAGVTSLESDLWYMPVQRPYNPNGKRMAEMMQADLAKVGIKVELKSFEWGEYRKRLQAGEHQMGLLGWTGDNGDPDNFFFLLGCAGGTPAGQNISKWCNKEFDDLLMSARTLTDVKERSALYAKMQEISKAEAPQVTIAHSTVFEPVRKEVEGYKVSPLGRHEFTGVSVK
jgi:dipeptide transport system substrate-binding protein